MEPRALSATGREWAIATPHWAATEAGVAAFGAGGNAIDAALAAAVALGVAYPQACGVGGDLFALVQDPRGQVTGVNASGAAPAGIDPEAIGRSSGTVPEYGPVPITVPGAVSGWAAVHGLGSRLDFSEAFRAAVAVAREGVPVASAVARSLASSAQRFATDPGMRSVFFPRGDPLREGEVAVQPALAETLEAISEKGPPVLYGGELGERYAAGLQRAGSPITIDDLARHEAELVPPLIGRYRELDVSTMPPNSQGFVLLEILAAVERLAIDPDPLGPDAAILARVFLAAAADRDRHNADPHHARVTVGTLLDDGHIASLCDQVRGDGSGRGRPGDGPGRQVPRETLAPTGDTIALVAADAEGWAVSLIQSLFYGFGSGILEPSTGIVAHNRGACFSLDPSSPNMLAGGKRPAHTLMPVLVHRDGALAAVAGTMGGFAQPQINAENLIRLFDLAHPPDEVLDAARWVAGGMDAGWARRTIDAEPGVPDRVTASLREAGFEVNVLPTQSGETGHAHVVLRRSPDRLEAATDPRADGSAAAA